MKTKIFHNFYRKPIRICEERSGRVTGDVGPLHDFPLQPGKSITLAVRKGIRLVQRWEKEDAK